jgi:hypothetical protein
MHPDNPIRDVRPEDVEIVDGQVGIPAADGTMQAGAEPASRDDLERRIDELEHQSETDRETIRDLAYQADADQETLHGLQLQVDVDHALIERLEAEGVIDRAAIANLQTALVTARRIGAAMGVPMASRKVTDDQAFDLLVRASQNKHRKLREIAEDVVVLTGTLPKL